MEDSFTQPVLFFPEDSADVSLMFKIPQTPEKCTLKPKLNKTQLAEDLSSEGHEHALDRFMLGRLQRKPKKRTPKKKSTSMPLLYIPGTDNPAIVTIDQEMMKEIIGQKAVCKPKKPKKQWPTVNSVLQEQNIQLPQIPTADHVTIIQEVETFPPKGDNSDEMVECQICNVKFDSMQRLRIHARAHRNHINNGKRTPTKNIMTPRKPLPKFLKLNSRSSSCQFEVKGQHLTPTVAKDNKLSTSVVSSCRKDVHRRNTCFSNDIDIDLQSDNYSHKSLVENGSHLENDVGVNFISTCSTDIDFGQSFNTANQNLEANQRKLDLNEQNENRIERKRDAEKSNTQENNSIKISRSDLELGALMTLKYLSAQKSPSKGINSGKVCLSKGNNSNHINCQRTSSNKDLDFSNIDSSKKVDYVNQDGLADTLHGSTCTKMIDFVKQLEQYYVTNIWKMKGSLEGNEQMPVYQTTSHPYPDDMSFLSETSSNDSTQSLERLDTSGNRHLGDIVSHGNDVVKSNQIINKSGQVVRKDNHVISRNHQEINVHYEENSDGNQENNHKACHGNEIVKENNSESCFGCSRTSSYLQNMVRYRSRKSDIGKQEIISNSLNDVDKEDSGHVDNYVDLDEQTCNIKDHDLEHFHRSGHIAKKSRNSVDCETGQRASKNLLSSNIVDGLVKENIVNQRSDIESNHKHDQTYHDHCNQSDQSKQKDDQTNQEDCNHDYPSKQKDDQSNQEHCNHDYPSKQKDDQANQEHCNHDYPSKQKDDQANQEHCNEKERCKQKHDQTNQEHCNEKERCKQKQTKESRSELGLQTADYERKKDPFLKDIHGKCKQLNKSISDVDIHANEMNKQNSQVSEISSDETEPCELVDPFNNSKDAGKVYAAEDVCYTETDIFTDGSIEQSPKMIQTFYDRSQREAFFEYRQNENEDSILIQASMSAECSNYSYVEDVTHTGVEKLMSRQEACEIQCSLDNSAFLQDLGHVNILDEKGDNSSKSNKGDKSGKKNLKLKGDNCKNKSSRISVVKDLFSKFKTTRNSNIYGHIMKFSVDKAQSCSTNSTRRKRRKTVCESLKKKCSRLCTYDENMERVKKCTSARKLTSRNNKRTTKKSDEKELDDKSSTKSKIKADNETLVQKNIDISFGEKSYIEENQSKSNVKQKANKDRKNLHLKVSKKEKSKTLQNGKENSINQLKCRAKTDKHDVLKSPSKKLILTELRHSPRKRKISDEFCEKPASKKCKNMQSVEGHCVRSSPRKSPLKSPCMFECCTKNNVNCTQTKLKNCASSKSVTVCENIKERQESKVKPIAVGKERLKNSSRFANDIDSTFTLYKGRSQRTCLKQGKRGTSQKLKVKLFGSKQAKERMKRVTKLRDEVKKFDKKEKKNIPVKNVDEMEKSSMNLRQRSKVKDTSDSKVKGQKRKTPEKVKPVDMPTSFKIMENKKAMSNNGSAKMCKKKLKISPEKRVQEFYSAETCNFKTPEKVLSLEEGTLDSENSSVRLTPKKRWQALFQSVSKEMETSKNNLPNNSKETQSSKVTKQVESFETEENGVSSKSGEISKLNSLQEKAQDFKTTNLPVNQTIFANPIECVNSNSQVHNSLDTNHESENLFPRLKPIMVLERLKHYYNSLELSKNPSNCLQTSEILDKCKTRTSSFKSICHSESEVEENDTLKRNQSNNDPDAGNLNSKELDQSNFMSEEIDQLSSVSHVIETGSDLDLESWSDKCFSCARFLQYIQVQHCSRTLTYHKQIELSRKQNE